MRTEQDDQDPEYGRWHTSTPEAVHAEEAKLNPPQEEKLIWPDWREGVPGVFRARIGNPAFYKDGVHYRYHTQVVSLNLEWNRPYLLTELARSDRPLPSTRTSEWSGVYRLFATDTVVERACGTDTTGTLYVGKAGTGRKKWSILRNRVTDLVRQKHNAFNHWHGSKRVQRRFPWAGLAVQWAFTGTILNHKGESAAEAERAEGFLLHSYDGSFGEFPPWVQRAD
jgi:hypothetical protein